MSSDFPPDEGWRRVNPPDNPAQRPYWPTVPQASSPGAGSDRENYRQPQGEGQPSSVSSAKHSDKPHGVSRRAFLLGTLAAGAGAAAGAYGAHGLLKNEGDPVAPAGKPAGSAVQRHPDPPGFTRGALIGDGSTSEQQPQPHQRPIRKLRPGETPPQFVVISWDGAANLKTGIMTRFRKIAHDTNASMTLFLTGLYFLPQELKNLYHPPKHPVGASDIGYPSRESAHRTIKAIGECWLEGHEIGTHFNGHFCGKNGGNTFSSQDWHQEISEAIKFVTTWRTITGFDDLPPLPFDYRKELIGARTPCLEGRTTLIPAAVKFGWRYDTSGTRSQIWPRRDSYGVWDTSLAMIPFEGRNGKGPAQLLSMDYNFLANQSAGKTQGDPSQFSRWKHQTVDSFMAGFDRAYNGNRAPYIIGNHFENWNGGIYMDAVEEVMRKMAAQPGVELVSMRQVINWMEAQSDQVLAKLFRLGVAESPAGGWANYLAE